MENQLVRLCILVVLVFLLTSDIKDLLEALSTTSTVGPYLTNWKSVPGPGEAQKRNSQHVSESYKRKFSNRRKRRENYLQEQEKQLEGSGEEQYLEDDEPVKFYTPIPTGRTSKTSKSQKKLNKVNPDNLFASLSEEEKEELLTMKSHLTKVMQEWCLPKLVCELHASLGERENLSEAERGLLAIIKETSLSPMGESISKYHFAAHMGQLLVDVQGNGCHNFYPNCPLSGTKVLQMVKKVRIR